MPKISNSSRGELNILTHSSLNMLKKFLPTSRMFYFKVASSIRALMPGLSPSTLLTG